MELRSKIIGAAYSVKNLVQKNNWKILAATGIATSIAAVPISFRGGMKYQKAVDDENLTGKEKKKALLKNAILPTLVEATSVVLTTMGFKCLDARYIATAAALALKTEESEKLKEKIKNSEESENGDISEEEVVDETSFDGYAFYWDARSSYYFDSSENDDYNDNFLRQRLIALNSLYATKKIITLKEVFDALGMKIEEMEKDPGMKKLLKASLVVGWRFDYSKPSGDMHINLRPKKAIYFDPVTGEKHRTYILDPNVDGDIFSDM